MKLATAKPGLANRKEAGALLAVSLRLNFEYNLECYDAELAARLEQLVEMKKAEAELVTLETGDRRGFPVRLLDGVARLLMPYL